MRNGEQRGRDALDTLIAGTDDEPPVLSGDERTLVENILRLHDRAAEDVMVPRADIVAVDSQATLSDVIDLMISSGHSRLPVYRDTLDDAIGMVHIKDVLAWRDADEAFQLAKIVRSVLFVAPSMEVLPLLLEMRAKRSHMALVVDEFGGVDGLLTIEDVVEEIVGEIADEHDRDIVLAVVKHADGSLDADARAPIDVFEEHFGQLLSEDERDEIDTLGGLVVSLAGRVPTKGELVSHPNGVDFEVRDADPRRIKRLRIRRRSDSAAAGEVARRSEAGGAA
ncbi:HlyC/CorC family transporter [Defluviicoccus vanus]|uniref:HlyC/CorC family transporter n=2 Tax=Defluviicoccus vanus TaxID=111831 RepID=A0A7H1N611_9PROT|nr:HlyC/CorC family transporter [Defluviicoccus vanus]